MKKSEWSLTEAGEEGQFLLRALCYGGFGKDRPTEFASKAGSGTILVVQKRAKSR
jgi:hypothetical protein